MGALPKPVEQKVLEGAPGRMRVDIGARKDEAIGDCPSGEPKEVQDIWNQLKEDWDLVLTVSDRPAFLVYCRTQYQYNKAWRKLQREGDMDYNSHGRAVIAAYAQRVSSLADQLMKLLPQFGATPVTRQRVATGETLSPNQMRKGGGLELLTGGRTD